MAATASPAREAIASPSSPLVGAAVASLGAGAIHAAAIGIHSEHRPAALAFTAVAAAQLGWGALALTRGGRAVVSAGLVVQGVALVGWLAAKTTGVGFVAGLEGIESVQVADGLAAGLAGMALVLGLRRLVDLVFGASSAGVQVAPARWVHPLLVAGVTVAALAATISATSHSHAGSEEVAAGGHQHGGPALAATASTAAAAAASDDHADHADGSAAAVAAPPKPYDPSQPIDLSGTDGVSPEQQAAAENLIAITLARLPHFADPEVAEGQGYSSIGDGVTGHEHLIKWDLIGDGKTLDPDYPEALVYDTSGGGRRLVAAMFMLEAGTSLDSVPELGGPLTQWHIHDNLCFTGGDAPRVAGITNGEGECRPGLSKLDPVPMIHVWITPHECGPFAALEGVGAGQINDGEERLCDHAHGS
ncbi:hypothetical protein BH24ACT4_BH24ACT4_07680 [soil metagenome]